MLNIIKADSYRVLRGKTIYITCAFLLFLVIISSLGHIGYVGVNVDVSMENIEEIESRTVNTGLTGSEAPFYLMQTSDNLLYFMLIIIFCIAASDFANGCAKNTLSQGISRSKLYFSKLILSIIYMAGAYLLYIIIPLIVNTLRNGFGTPGDDYFGRLFAAAGLQFILLSAVVAVGIFIVFATRKTGAIIGCYLAFSMAPMILVYILTQLNPWFEKLYNYDIINNIRSLANISVISSSDIIRALLIAAFYIAASTAGGLALFKKCEIK